jgi:putative transposase
LDSKTQTTKGIFKKKKSIEFIIDDETQIKIGSELIWLWIATEIKNKEILAPSISLP